MFDYLDQRVGLQNVLITLSADHGFMNIPEYSASRSLDAGRIDPDKMIEATNAALSAKFGDGKYITAWWNPTLYVDYKLIELASSTRSEVENAAQEFLRDYPGVEAVFTRTQMEQGMMPATKLAKQVIAGLASEDQRRHRRHEQAELVPVREAEHLRLDPRLALVVRHQRAAGHVRTKLVLPLVALVVLAVRPARADRPVTDEEKTSLCPSGCGGGARAARWSSMTANTKSMMSNAATGKRTTSNSTLPSG